MRLVADPATATDKQLQDEKLSVGEYAAYYRAKFRALAGWVRKELMGQ